MPSTFQNITARVAAGVVGGNPKVAPNTFIRDTAVSGFAILVGRTRSSYIAEGRVGRGGKVSRFTLGTVGRMTLDEARAAAKEKVAGFARGVDPVAALRAKRGAAVTVRQALTYLTKPKPATVEGYRRDMERLGWIDRRVASITDAVVTAAYEKRKDHPTSTARMMRGFRSVWHAAKRKHPELPKLCPTGALREVNESWATAPRKRRVIADAVMPQWRKQVETIARDDVRDLLLFLLYTGCRVGESKALTQADIDLRAGCFTLAAPKNGSPVDLPITKQVREILARRIKASPDGKLLFPQGDIRKSHAGVDADPWSYHDLRRGYVTTAHRLGIDDQIARALTNHATPKGDAHAGYVSMTPDTLRPDAQRIADHLDGLARNDLRARMEGGAAFQGRHKRGPKQYTIGDANEIYEAVARHVAARQSIDSAAKLAAKEYPATPATMKKIYYIAKKFLDNLTRVRGSPK